MPSLGPLEILVIFIVALLVFGPNKLPELARQVGKGLAEFRKVQHHLREELDDAIHSVMDDDKPKVDPPVVTDDDKPKVAPPVVTESTPTPAVEGAPALASEPLTVDASEVPAPADVTPPLLDAGAIDVVDESRGVTGPTPPPLADDA